MIGESVTVLRVAGAVGFGERGGFELTSGRDTVTTQPTLYTPPGADITSTDRVRVRGEVFAVDGKPADWRSPTTGAPVGLAVPLKGVSG